MKVMIVKELMTGDVSPVAMFTARLPLCLYLIQCSYFALSNLHLWGKQGVFLQFNNCRVFDHLVMENLIRKARRRVNLANLHLLGFTCIAVIKQLTFLQLVVSPTPGYGDQGQR